MNRPLRTEEDYAHALAAVRRLWGAPEGSAAGNRLGPSRRFAPKRPRDHVRFPGDHAQIGQGRCVGLLSVLLPVPQRADWHMVSSGELGLRNAQPLTPRKECLPRLIPGAAVKATVLSPSCDHLIRAGFGDEIEQATDDVEQLQVGGRRNRSHFMLHVGRGHEAILRCQRSTPPRQAARHGPAASSDLGAGHQRARIRR